MGGWGEGGGREREREREREITNSFTIGFNPTCPYAKPFIVIVERKRERERERERVVVFTCLLAESFLVFELHAGCPPCHLVVGNPLCPLLPPARLPSPSSPPPPPPPSLPERLRSVKSLTLFFVFYSYAFSFPLFTATRRCQSTTKLISY